MICIVRQTYYKYDMRLFDCVMVFSVEFLRYLKVPLPLKYLLCFGMMATWKWFYYGETILG